MPWGGACTVAPAQKTRVRGSVGAGQEVTLRLREWTEWCLEEARDVASLALALLSLHLALCLSV